MKKKVKEVIQKKVDTAKKEMTKMRFIKSCEIESYIDKVNYDDCVTLLKTRLNMIETKLNLDSGLKTFMYSTYVGQ